MINRMSNRNGYRQAGALFWPSDRAACIKQQQRRYNRRCCSTNYLLLTTAYS